MPIMTNARRLPPEDILREKKCGDYDVQVVKSHVDGQPCYRVMWGCMKCACSTREEERYFPKDAATLGHEMVRREISGEPEPEDLQLSLF